MNHIFGLAICYMAVAVIACAILVGQSLSRALARRKYRVRVVTIGPTLSRAFSQQTRPVARTDVDVPTARRTPMGDPLRTRKRSPRSTPS